ncbi:MAG: S1 RNA-binding domain-containing protein [bacterium]
MTTEDIIKNKESAELSEFEKLLLQFDYSFKKGDIVKGRVIGYDSNNVLVDIGAKTTARVPQKELLGPQSKTPQETLPVDNTEKEFLIIREEDEDGQLTISYKKVALAYAWKELEKIQAEDEAVEAEVTASVKGGMLVDVMGLRGFVPSSHIRARDPEELVGKKVQLKILSVDSKQNNLIMSHRKVVSEQQAEQRKDLFENIQIGQIVTGDVVRLADFGAFIDIGGIDGLLPLSQISWRWVDHPADVLKVGDKIKVEIIGVDEEKQRVSLSLKSQQPDPWIEASKIIKEGEKINGKVIRIKHFGAFIEVYPGVEALLPYKEILDHQNKTGKTLQQGDEIETTVIRFFPEDRRISLSLSDRPHFEHQQERQEPKTPEIKE